MKSIVALLLVVSFHIPSAHAQVGLLERMQQQIDALKAKLDGTVVPPPVVPPPVPPPTGGSGVNTIIPIVQTGAETNVPFTVPAAGNYIIWARILAPTFSADSCFVSVDNGAEDIADMAENVQGPNFQWRRVPGRSGSTVPAAVTPRLFALVAGNHSVKFREREPGLQINAILITSDPAFVPTGGTLPPPVVPPPVVPPPPPQPPPPDVPPVLVGNEIIVSPTGTAGGAGTMASPKTLDAVVAATLAPGTTVFLLPGVYRSATWYNIKTNGTAAAPIVYRSDGKAIVEGIIEYNGSHNIVRDIVVVGYDLKRISTQVMSWTPPDLKVGGVLFSTGTGNKLINSVVHGVNNNCVSVWGAATVTEVYGNVIYDCGWTGPDRAHGHGIYTQNAPNTGVKLFEANIIFWSHMYGAQVFGSGNIVHNFHFLKNIFFNAGALDGTGHVQLSMILGSGSTSQAKGIRLLDNHSYHTSPLFTGMSIGYYYGGAKNQDLALERNTFTNTTWFYRWASIIGTGNKFYGPVQYETVTGASATVPATGNTFATARPATGIEQYLIPNRYDSKRANLLIYNWAKAPSVSADLSGVLKIGQAYEIKDVQNYFGVPVAQGTYNGPVNLPLAGLVAFPPLGNVVARPSHSAPDFGAFVVIGK